VLEGLKKMTRLLGFSGIAFSEPAMKDRKKLWLTKYNYYYWWFQLEDYVHGKLG